MVNIINFPTCIQKNTATDIDNIFIDISKITNYSLSPIVNALSDHDAQLLILNTYNTEPPFKTYMIISKMEDYKIAIFLNKLSFENWESTFFSGEVNIMFNSLLDTYLKIFFTRFPSQRIEINKRNKNWITSGIITSCKYKRAIQCM